MTKERWSATLKAVKNPLTIFALALLVVEATMATLAGFKLQGQDLVWAITAMALLFVVVIVIVAVITFLRPTHLYEQRVSELTDAIHSDGYQDVIEDTIINFVKEECLRNPKEN